MTKFDRCYSAHQKVCLRMFVLTVDYFRDDLKAPSSSLLKLSVCCLVCQARKSLWCRSNSEPSRTKPGCAGETNLADKYVWSWAASECGREQEERICLLSGHHEWRLMIFHDSLFSPSVCESVFVWDCLLWKGRICIILSVCLLQYEKERDSSEGKERVGNEMEWFESGNSLRGSRLSFTN